MAGLACFAEHPAIFFSHIHVLTFCKAVTSWVTHSCPLLEGRF